MARNLESGVGELECSSTVIAARVLRADEFFEHIEVRAFEARTQTEAHSLWKFSDLGDDPTQDVAGQDHGGRFFHTRFFAAGAFGAGGKGHDVLQGLGTFGAVIGDAELRCQ